MRVCLSFPVVWSKGLAVATQRIGSVRDSSRHQEARRSQPERNLGVWPDCRHPGILWLASWNTENHSHVPITTFHNHECLFHEWKSVALTNSFRGYKCSRNTWTTAGTVPFVRGENVSIRSGQRKPRKRRKLQTLPSGVHCQRRATLNSTEDDDVNRCTMLRVRCRL